jgi:nucleotide-binding universal stress UspA family protein
MNKEQAIHRILVALDSSPASLTVLEQAVELASGFKAELVGLFVEDINLVRLAELSFTQEVGLFSGTSRRLEIHYVERQFRSQANRVRQAMASLAGKAGITWSFRVVRGVIATELLNAALETDLIVLGRVGASARRRRLGSTTRAILFQTPQLTLIIHPGSRLQLPFLIFYDGSVTAQKALLAAAQLSRTQEDHLIVLVLADTQEETQQLQQEVDTTLKAYNLTARYLRGNKVDTQNLLRIIQLEQCGMLVLPSNGVRLDSDTILALLDQIECPVLLVR